MEGMAGAAAEIAPKEAISEAGGVLQKDEVEDRVIDAALVVIQRAWKSYSQKVVSLDLYRYAQEVMAIEGWMEIIPTAKYGNTFVGFPQGLDVVIKRSLITRHGDRKDEMHQAHDVCEMLKLETMLVPKVRRFGDFLIEDRVRFESCDYTVQTKLYMKNREVFTQTAIDFVRFLMYSYTFDLVHPKQTFEHGLALPRYDNAVLYIREVDGAPLGMMALVDIERFSKGFPDFHTKATVQDVSTALRFFPLHAREIISTALMEFPYLVEHESELREKAKEALETQKALL